MALCDKCADSVLFDHDKYANIDSGLYTSEVITVFQACISEFEADGSAELQANMETILAGISEL